MQEHFVMDGGPRSPGPYTGFFSRPASSDLGVIAGCPGLRTWLRDGENLAENLAPAFVNVPRTFHTATARKGTKFAIL